MYIYLQEKKLQKYIFITILDNNFAVIVIYYLRIFMKKKMVKIDRL